MYLDWPYIKETKLRWLGIQIYIKKNLEKNNIWRTYRNQQNLKRSKTSELMSCVPIETNIIIVIIIITSIDNHEVAGSISVTSTILKVCHIRSV